MIKTILVLLIGLISISFGSIFIRLCHDVPAIMIATYRLLIAALILLVVSKARGDSPLRDVRREELMFSLLGGIFLTLHFITWIASLKYTSIANSVVLVNTNPIFVGIFSYLFLKEKQDIELIIGIVLSLLGSLAIALSDSGLHGTSPVDSGALWGDLLALAGAVSASGYLLVGSKVRERLDILTYVTMVYTVSAILLLGVSVFLGIPFVGYNKASYLYLVLLALVPQLVGHTSINWALKHLKTSMVAITILGEPVGATLLAYLIFSETIGNVQGIGMILIFGGIITASRRGKKPGGNAPMAATA